MKKILCLLLACVLLAGLCACGASPAPAAQPAAETSSPEELAYQEVMDLLFVNPDHDLAFSRLTEWSDTEYAPLQALIGECYWQGFGTEVDYEKAFDYFSRAAEQGNLPGMYGVAMSTFFGSGIPADKIKGTDLLLEVMELSLAAAEETEDPVEKGRLYYQYAFPKMFVIAYTAAEHQDGFEVLEKSADCGYPDAEFWAGLLYKGFRIETMSGQPLLYMPEKDYDRGEAYLVSADEHGNKNAARAIGVEPG